MTINQTPEPWETSEKQLQLFIHLVPIIGFFPSLWTLSRRQGSREQQEVSRQSVTLALMWVIAYSLLSSSWDMPQLWTFRLLLINGLLTSGYFGLSIWMMFRVRQGKSIRLPGIRSISEGIVRKHLS
jgi:hypothetical protein